MNNMSRPGKMMAGFLSLIILAGTAIFFDVSKSNGAEEKPWPTHVRMLYLPAMGKAATVKRFQPLTDHLARSLHLPVEGISVASYDDIFLPLAKGQFEVTWLAPLIYLDAAHYSPLEVVALELNRNGDRGYHSIFICRADRRIRSMAEARGKVIAFTEPKSTSGFLFPLMYVLKELKETPASFAKKAVLAGDHDKVIRGVYEGLYDVGATNDMDMDRILKAENIPPSSFRVIWTSELIPGLPVGVRSDLPKSFKSAVQKALLEFNQDLEGIRALQIGGYSPATAKDYESMREPALLK